MTVRHRRTISTDEKLRQSNEQLTQCLKEKQEMASKILRLEEQVHSLIVSQRRMTEIQSPPPSGRTEPLRHEETISEPRPTIGNRTVTEVDPRDTSAFRRVLRPSQSARLGSGSSTQEGMGTGSGVGRYDKVTLQGCLEQQITTVRKQTSYRATAQGCFEQLRRSKLLNMWKRGWGLATQATWRLRQRQTLLSLSCDAA